MIHNNMKEKLENEFAESLYNLITDRIEAVVKKELDCIIEQKLGKNLDVLVDELTKTRSNGESVLEYVLTKRLNENKYNVANITDRQIENVTSYISKELNSLKSENNILKKEIDNLNEKLLALNESLKEIKDYTKKTKVESSSNDEYANSVVIQDQSMSNKYKDRLLSINCDADKITEKQSSETIVLDNLEQQVCNKLIEICSSDIIMDNSIEAVSIDSNMAEKFGNNGISPWLDKDYVKCIAKELTLYINNGCVLYCGLRVDSDRLVVAPDDSLTFSEEDIYKSGVLALFECDFNPNVSYNGFELIRPAMLYKKNTKTDGYSLKYKGKLHLIQ